jgi:hypothetical protein
MATDILTDLIMVPVGALFMVAAFKAESMGAPFSHGGGPQIPLSFAGRLVLFAGGLFAAIWGVNGLIH